MLFWRQNMGLYIALQTLCFRSSNLTTDRDQRLYVNVFWNVFLWSATNKHLKWISYKSQILFNRKTTSLISSSNKTNKQKIPPVYSLCQKALSKNMVGFVIERCIWSSWWPLQRKEFKFLWPFNKVISWSQM